MKTTEMPRQRRTDIINNLPPGGQKRIARQLGISRTYVSAVLNGHRNQHNSTGINIIRIGEHMAGRNLFEYHAQRIRK